MASFNVGERAIEGKAVIFKFRRTVGSFLPRSNDDRVRGAKVSDAAVVLVRVTVTGVSPFTLRAVNLLVVCFARRFLDSCLVSLDLSSGASFDGMACCCLAERLARTLGESNAVFAAAVPVNTANM